MSGHYICDHCGYDGGEHPGWCRNYRAPLQTEKTKVDSFPEGDFGISFDPVLKRINIATDAIHAKRGTSEEWLALVMDIGSELNRVLRNRYPEPLWDAYHNRSYEPVEALAKEIYAAFDAPSGVRKPDWFPGGNSDKQDEARVIARRQLREVGHTPSMTRPASNSEAK